MDEKVDDSEKVGIFRAFSDPNYRTASWVCACLSVFMQFAGIDFVCVYATLIIEKMLKKSGQTHSSMSPGFL
jgi:uncharacterized membrane protein